MDENQQLTGFTLPTKKDYPGFIEISGNWLNPNTVLADVYFLSKKIQRGIIRIDYKKEKD